MINVSNAFKQGLENGEKVWIEVDITFSDGTLKHLKDEIMSGNNLFSDCAESSSFPIGCVICKSMTLELDNTSDQWKNYNFYMAKVHAYLKMQTSVASQPVTDELLDENYDQILDQSGGTILATKAATEDRIETIDKGVYTITTPEQYGEIISFTALDDMYKANAAYISHLVLPQSIETLVRDACKTLGIPSEVSMTHGNLIVSEIPENMTFRQLFGWAAMLETANARLDNRGYLQFIRWNLDATPSIELKDYINMPTVSSDDIVITGINIKNGDNSETYGTSGYILSMENNLVGEADLATVVAQIGDSIIGAKFRNLKGDMAFNPLLEFGDVVYTYDRNLNQYVTPLTDVSCTVNGKTTVKTQADDPIRGMSKFVSDGTKAIVEARRLAKKEQSAREEAVKKLEETLKNSSGLYETSVAQEDGSTITYLHDKPTLAESKNVIKFTSEAIGISNDGGKTYPYGFFLTGDLIAKILYAHGINADYIDTGALIVRDSNGNIIFQADMSTGTVYISGSVQIGGGATLDSIKQTADDAAKKSNEASEAAAAARNMTLILSNEFQAIAADSDGNIATFPECKTTATVMYGATDVTAECTFTVTKSDNVTGSWDDSTHTYTVTGLTADDGWVDIKATYIKALSITKRFSLAKQKAGSQGTDGESGRSYLLESSCSIIKQKENGELEPTYINFEAFYFDGTSAERKDDTGFYTIEESSDGGVTWEEVYRSESNEHSVKHHMYSAIKAYYYDTTGFRKSGALAGSDGSGGMIAFGVPKTVTDVRCNFYARGMYAPGVVIPESKKIASKTISVISEKVKSLSQSDIVEILSDNGKFNGLYYVGGKLYISLSALLGGEMTLGGVNNGNGLFRLRDASNNLVGKFDKDGLLIANPDLQYGGYRLDKSGIQFVTVKNDYSDISEELGGSFSVGNDLQVYLVAHQIDVDSALIDDITVATINSTGRDLSIGGRVTIQGYTYLQKVDNASTSYSLRIDTNGLLYKTSSSSRRYKNIGAPISEQDIADWYDIQPVWASYKDGYLAKGDEREGVEFPMFEAENVEEHMPLAVDHLPDGRVETWNERVMIPMMFAMLKSQKDKIDKMQETIDTLMEKIGE